MSETYGFFLIALCLIGTIGNLLTLVILRRKNDKKKSTNWLLQAVAVVDSLYLLTRLLAVLCQFVTCRYALWLPLAVSQAFAVITPYVESSASLAHMISVWTVVVITVDRYIAVCLPGEVHLRTVHRANSPSSASSRRRSSAVCRSSSNGKPEVHSTHWIATTSSRWRCDLTAHGGFS